MDRTLYDEYNQAYTSGAYGEMLDEISRAYENGYQQGKFEARQTGKWVPWKAYYGKDRKSWTDELKCSECGFKWGDEDYKFCPMCGAKMGDEE